MIKYTVRKSYLWLLLLAMVLLISGCIGRNAPKVTHFSLLTMAQLGDTEAIASFPEINLGVGPVTIPDSLKRSQIVTRQHGNQYEFDEFNRWAGVLEKDFASVVGDNFSVLLGVNKVDFFPWLHYFKPDYRIVIDVVRLDGALDGDAVLSARWVVTNTSGKDILAGAKSDYRMPLETADYAALIKAESKLVAKLSQEIAGAIVALQK